MIETWVWLSDIIKLSGDKGLRKGVDNVMMELS